MATNWFDFSLKMACFLVLAATLLNLASFRSSNVVSAQTPQSFEKVVHAKRKHFIEYQQDFLHFGQSSLGTEEYQLAMDLLKVAEETVQSLDATSSLLEIYRDLSCAEDRARVRLVIERDLGYYSKMIEPSIEGANLSPHTRGRVQKRTLHAISSRRTPSRSRFVNIMA